MGKISIGATDGSGTFSAYVSLPQGGKGPGMLVIQEIWGVNGFLRETCDRYAALGYVAIAPDLFWRIEPGLDLNPDNEADRNKGFELFGKFDANKAVEDLKATLAVLRAHESCTGKAGTVGYCLGGKLAYLMATHSDADASVGYYGVGIQDMLGEASSIKKPLMLHLASEDKFVPPEAQALLQRELGKIPNVQVHIYPGTDHAFARTGGDHYDAAAAKLANDRTEALFAASLK